ncbi:hypothetical protein TNCT_394921 [Trichonephila clavata]|uniref:Uncharacterized protein n=1 Tax=Trichonephila clavata TaxID=2740835 RepID=A0A8X6GM73_TRICU|nr:hypothetical protein TNCT_394921 [Trichonephila clavata]
MLLGSTELSSVLECIFCKPILTTERRKSSSHETEESVWWSKEKWDEREKTKVKCVITASNDFSSRDLALASIGDR